MPTTTTDLRAWLLNAGVDLRKSDDEEMTPDEEAAADDKAEADAEAEQMGDDDDVGDDSGEGEAVEKSEGEGTRGGKVVGHTASGKPVYEASHPSYTAKQRLPKMNVEAGPMHSSVSDTHKRQMMRARFPDHTSEDHKDAAKVHGDLAAKHEAAHAKLIDAADKKHNVPKFGAGRLAGGGHPLYDSATNEKIRNTGRLAQDHKDAARAHMTASQFMRKSEVEGGLHDWLQKAGGAAPLPSGTPTIPQTDAQGMSPADLDGAGKQKAEGGKPNANLNKVDAGGTAPEIDDRNDATPLGEGEPGIKTLTKSIDEADRFKTIRGTFLRLVKAGPADVKIEPSAAPVDDLKKSRTPFVPATTTVPVDDGTIAVASNSTDLAVEAFQKSESFDRLPRHGVDLARPLFKSEACPKCGWIMASWLSKCTTCGAAR